MPIKHAGTATDGVTVITAEMWNADHEGTAGVTGPTGPTGTAGDVGPTGPTGSTGAGDMTKAVYDADDDGIVDTVAIHESATAPASMTARMLWIDTSS